ncbi:hypothetical protein [Thermostaphylospora chromogena]|uniref:Uncharacterized protein n=1 Tax=Thermostaphylospora chromogena TaxID=35622 RepID=A0A1H1AS87_9ACTN|nr:hypothetical protein [Thermostaphylospora chromogena]SDQ42500.1 hypothetical protein SAMN04489764_0630 [Thermostaphylospora chromogena]
MTDFPVARTRDEALLYLDLHPCACGSAETDWDNSLATVDGVMVSRYAGVCGGCGAQREYLFALPERETPVAGFPTFGGEEPSRLLDAGEWLWVADRVASNVPRGEERQALSVARAAVDEVIKFIEPGGKRVPDDAFWTERGRAVRDAEPGRFDLERLLVVRDAYRTLASY